MLRKFGIIAVLSLMALALAAVPALAQSGHFVTGGGNAPSCRDAGTTVLCTTKVAGLGGTTFEVQIDAVGIASVECENPGGNVAPGQDTTVETSGTTGTLPTPRNGAATVSVSTLEPAPLPATPTCPNAMWTPTITDVTFTEATLTLLEDGVISDQITVPVT